MSDTGRKVMVETQKLRKYYAVKASAFRTDYVQAVQDVSLHIYEGETLGLVGESGCGKTTYGRTLLQLYQPTSGRILYDGQVIFDSENKVRVNMKPYRRKMQLIFQDPSACLNPRRTVRQILTEPFLIHGMQKSVDINARILGLLQLVGMEEYHLSRYPHELSGGQKQRIGIARALALEPKLIVCDEAVSALDVSIQAQVLNLLQELKRKLSLTYVFISHNLNVVYQVSDRVAVMYLGRIVELADCDTLFERYAHPYTEVLLSAIPQINSDASARRIHLQGEVPNPADPPRGCHFHPRCPKACEQCRLQEPLPHELEPGHFVACHLA